MWTNSPPWNIGFASPLLGAFPCKHIVKQLLLNFYQWSQSSVTMDSKRDHCGSDQRIFQHAADLLLTGRLVTAQEALSMGLVARSSLSILAKFLATDEYDTPFFVALWLFYNLQGGRWCYGAGKTNSSRLVHLCSCVCAHSSHHPQVCWAYLEPSIPDLLFLKRHIFTCLIQGPRVKRLRSSLLKRGYCTVSLLPNQVGHWSWKYALDWFIFFQPSGTWRKE